MKSVVADASVLAAIAFQDPRSDEVEAWLAERQLHEPPRHPRDAAALETNLAVVLAMGFLWESMDQCAAFQLAVQTELSGFDAAYLWVAHALGMPLVTFDEQLATVAAELGLA